jgi:LEA14-like dessication related protein
MRRVLPLLLLPLAVGCDEFALQDYVPTVQFQRLDLVDIDFQHIEADFVFSVDNPNPVEIGLSSFSYDLDLEGENLLEGDNEEGFALEAIGSSELRLPLDLGWEDAWSTAQATRGEDYVDFALGGHFGFMTPLGEGRVPYREDGDFPALRTPTFSFQKVRVANLNLLTQTATIEVDLGVDNAHRSTLFFDAVDYRISLAGTRVATGFIDEFGSVAGATEGTLTIPVGVDLLAVGATVVDALVNKTPVQVGLEATMDVDTPFGIVPLDLDELAQVAVE